MKESKIVGIKNRILQIIALFSPGATSFRVYFHKWRGVKIGKGVWIGYDVILETSRPKWVSIGNDSIISMRSTFIAHWELNPSIDKEKDYISINIEKDAFIGPGAIILPNVTIGEGAVVAAGTVVSRNVPPKIMVRGNPAVPIAKCGIPLTPKTSIEEFSRKLRPIKKVL
jgi:acetyltransferase-like isoleucine patch superfamily enzyme